MVIYICDDEIVYVDKILQFISEYNLSRDTNVIVKDYTDEDEMMDEIIKCRDADLIFLDIELEKRNGLIIANEIKNMMSSVSIAYITAYDNYYNKIFHTEPIGFIKKPPRKEEIFFVIDTKMKRIKDSDKSQLKIVCEHKRLGVPIDKVLYVSSNLRKITIVTSEAEYSSYEKLDDVELRIKEMDKNFLRIHKSTLINLRYMKRYENNSIIMWDGKDFAISKAHKEEVNNRYIEYIKERALHAERDLNEYIK